MHDVLFSHSLEADAKDNAQQVAINYERQVNGSGTSSLMTVCR